MPKIQIVPDDQTTPDAVNATAAETDNQTDAPPKWAADFMSKVDGRLGEFGRDIARIRKRAKGADETQPTDEPKAEAASAEPKATGGGLTRNDLAAAMRLGEMRAQLGDKARERLDSMVEDGRAYSDVLEVAEILIETSAKGATPAANQPRSHGGTPAQSRAGVPHPTSVSEYKALPREQQDKLFADPSFEFSKLSRR